MGQQRFQQYLTLSEGRLKHGVLPEDRLRAQLDYQNAHVQAVASQQA